MKNLPYHHLPNGKFRNLYGIEMDKNTKFDYSTFIKEKKKIKDITIDFADEHTQHVLRCMKREYERMYDLFKNKKHKLVYYEDLDLSNLKWKKLWTWEEKKSICKNMHIAEEIIG